MKEDDFDRKKDNMTRRPPKEGGVAYCRCKKRLSSYKTFLVIEAVEIRLLYGNSQYWRFGHKNNVFVFFTFVFVFFVFLYLMSSPRSLLVIIWQQPVSGVWSQEQCVIFIFFIFCIFFFVCT